MDERAHCAAGIAESQGYGTKVGLASLAEKVLGIRMHKDRGVCMSNWEAAWLTKQQIG